MANIEPSIAPYVNTCTLVQLPNYFDGAKHDSPDIPPMLHATLTYTTFDSKQNSHRHQIHLTASKAQHSSSSAAKAANLQHDGKHLRRRFNQKQRRITEKWDTKFSIAIDPPRGSHEFLQNLLLGSSRRTEYLPQVHQH